MKTMIYELFRPNDIVLVNYDGGPDGKAVTLLRRYHAPWLVTTDPADPLPVLVDGSDGAVVMATVEASWRTRSQPD